MRIKRFIPAFITVMTVSVLLSGCGSSMKIARAAGKFGAALQTQPITSATAEISAGASVIADGVSAESRFRTVVRSRVDWESGRTYSDISSAVSVNGTEIPQTMQCYTSGESGESVRYLHVDGLNTWLRLQNQKRAADVDPELIRLLLQKVSEEMTMEDLDNTAGGNLHHILRMTFQGEDIRSFAESAELNLPQELRECDLSSVTIPVELEIEDKTFLPVRLQIRIQGIGQSLTDALTRTFGKGNELQNVEVRLEDISLLITNFGYGAQDIPMLPKGAAEKALDMEKIRELQNSGI